MSLHHLFVKPVGRPIEGVIKADDEAKLRNEFEEYVLTDVVHQRLSHFLDAYTNYAGANGVWISGFFGSGKSHLLKLLAYLLENREIDGVPAADLFLPKLERINDAIFKSDLKRALAIPSRSILFNIDQRADVINKTQIDALVAVFFKVFDEMRGYYGKQGHVAQFERDLDNRGVYQAFKDAYQQIAGKSWEKGREQHLLEGNNIARAYAQTTGEEEEVAKGILDKYRQQHHLSIEDFADQVKEYLDHQPANFRLNFFVDEVGQFIAENVKLMTNLQTIAESLATKCKGRAWVIVTSQSDMENILGQMNRQQTNDFSKIQARFANKILLTSSNVAEVIQKRLLAKNEDGILAMEGLYHREQNNFGTLFSFGDGSRTYKSFADREHFINSYPFVPYQFELFQSSIVALSEHNAFEGKHSSVGERSMLGVFQHVAIHIEDKEVGQLATFDLMFEGIQTALKSTVQRSILAAERQLGKDSLELKVLKNLFLVKYVTEFKSTLRNLCVLLIDHFDQDLPKLRRQVEEALNVLEQQTYIRRNGDLYEFLTDEEKDIEQDIKNTDVDSQVIADTMAKLVFERVIKNRKIRFDTNGQDYAFAQKMDDRLIGRDQELAIHVISPLHDLVGQENTLRLQNSGKDELMVIMPADDRIVRELLMVKKTDKYCNQTISLTQQEAVRSILSIKLQQNNDKMRELEDMVRTRLGQARLFVAGTAVDNSSEDAQTRVSRGFQELITRAYPNLRMLQGITYQENDLVKFLDNSQQSFLTTDVANLSEAEQEMQALITRNKLMGNRTTVKIILENFEKKPYGWYYAAILCVLAKLIARGKVELREDSNLLENPKVIEAALRNTARQGNTIVDLCETVTDEQLRRAKQFYRDFFDTPTSANEVKTIGQDIQKAFLELQKTLIELLAQKNQYPFVEQLRPYSDEIRGMVEKPYVWFVTGMSDRWADWLTAKTETIDPIRRLMGGTQKAIYDRARDFVISNQANLPDLDGDLLVAVKTTLEDLTCYQGGKIQPLKANTEKLQDQLKEQLVGLRAQAKSAVDEKLEQLAQTADYEKLSAEQHASLIRPFTAISDQLDHQTTLAVIRNQINQVTGELWTQALNQLARMANPPPVGPDITPVKEIIPVHSVRVSVGKTILADESDVEQYLTALRTEMLRMLRDNKQFNL